MYMFQKDMTIVMVITVKNLINIITMKKIILIIVGVLVIGGGVYAYMQTQSSEPKAAEKTINLMGIEMNEQQARDHCKVMPQMAGCEPYLN